jgi:hypothetical protein
MPSAAAKGLSAANYATFLKGAGTGIYPCIHCQPRPKCQLESDSAAKAYEKRSEVEGQIQVKTKAYSAKNNAITQA